MALESSLYQRRAPPACARWRPENVQHRIIADALRARALSEDGTCKTAG